MKTSKSCQGKDTSSTQSISQPPFTSSKVNCFGLRLGILIAVIAFLLLISSCLKIDPLLKQKVLTTIFDGVPEMPTIEELCEDNVEDLFNDYYEEKIAEAALGDWEKDERKDAKEGSKHRPWFEKDCKGCHNFKAQNKLHLPKNKICYLCHKNFIQGSKVHGPVAVGSCLACHDPHSSPNPSLLKRSLKTICFKCHIEERLAAEMHDKIISSGMFCVDCHDPHSRNIRYFLK